MSLFLWYVLGLPNTVTATENVLAENWLETVPAWTVYGTAVSSEEGRRITLNEVEGEIQGGIKDIAIPANRAGDWALFVAYTRAERVHLPVSASMRNVSGVPVLSGAALDRQGKILNEWQGQQMTHRGGKDGQWVVSFGRYKIPSGTAKIRFEAKQASRLGTPKDGRKAEIFQPGLYLLPTAARAQTVIQRYREGLSALIDLEVAFRQRDTVERALYDVRRNKPLRAQDACGPVPTDLRVAADSFERGQVLSNRRSYGSLRAGWSLSYPQYRAHQTVSGFATDQAHEGERSLALVNAVTRASDGQEMDSQDPLDESIGYDVTGLFEGGESYQWAAWVKYVGPGDGADLWISKESRDGQGIGETDDTRVLRASRSWNCLTFEGVQQSRRHVKGVLVPTEERITLFFGAIPVGGTVYLDHIQLIK